MDNDSASPWWFDHLDRITLARPKVDDVIDKLEDYTGRTIADREAYHRALEDAASCYFETVEDVDQRRLAVVRDEYRDFVKNMDRLWVQLKRITSTEPLAHPLCMAAFYSNFSVAEAEEKLGHGLGGSSYDSAQVGAKLAYKQFTDLHTLFRSALALASWEADHETGHGANRKTAREQLATDLAELYEATIGERAPRYASSPFVRHFNDVWEILEPDDPPDARTILRYLKTAEAEINWLPEFVRRERAAAEAAATAQLQALFLEVGHASSAPDERPGCGAGLMSATATAGRWQHIEESIAKIVAERTKSLVASETAWRALVSEMIGTLLPGEQLHALHGPLGEAGPPALSGEATGDDK